MLTDFLAHLNATRHLDLTPGDLTPPLSVKDFPERPGDYAVATDPASNLWKTAHFDGQAWRAVGFTVEAHWVWRGLREPAHAAPEEPLEDWATRTLQDMRRKTLLALNDLRADAQSAIDSGSRGGDEIDRASAHADQETRQRAAGVLTGRLRDIDEAIARLSRGDYGICEATGEEISRARLKANPLARHTLEYQQRIESARRGYASQN